MFGICHFNKFKSFGKSGMSNLILSKLSFLIVNFFDINAENKVSLFKAWFEVKYSLKYYNKNY